MHTSPPEVLPASKPFSLHNSACFGLQFMFSCFIRFAKLA